jgi:uncharacterized protein (TIGR02145 family)
MRKIYNIIFFIGLIGYSQKVINTVIQKDKNIFIITFDLESIKPCKANLFVSENGGITFQGPLKKITGDDLDNLISGNHKILWNYQDEIPSVNMTQALFKVIAIENIETVIIGNQEWATRNLDVTRYRNGDIIPEIKDYYQWLSSTKGAWCYYNNDSKNGDTYGKLYNWYAVKDPRGLAPEGFHIPSENEWRDLRNYLNGNHKYDVSGIKLVKKYEPNNIVMMNHMQIDNLYYDGLKKLLNVSGFNGLYGGLREFKYYRRTYGFNGLSKTGCFWSSTSEKNYFTINNGSPSEIYHEYPDKAPGYSIRCIKD